jgi:predicted O-methyltransferase YrrM
MISGHLQGRVLAMIARMIKPKRILEIGTFTGYSAICMAEGLDQQGEIITIDKNHELKELVEQYFRDAEIESKVAYIIGDAKKEIPRLKGIFDLVYLDADKENYSHYFDLIIDKVSPGGYILADNVLWYGKVLDSYSDKLDAETRAIKAFNRKVQKDKRVENVLLPIRDGLMAIRKI